MKDSGNLDWCVAFWQNLRWVDKNVQICLGRDIVYVKCCMDLSLKKSNLSPIKRRYFVLSVLKKKMAINPRKRVLVKLNMWTKNLSGEERRLFNAPWCFVAISRIFNSPFKNIFKMGVLDLCPKRDNFCPRYFPFTLWMHSLSWQKSPFPDEI